MTFPIRATIALTIVGITFGAGPTHAPSAVHVALPSIGAQP